MASPTASSAVTSEPASVMYVDPGDAPSVVCACAPPRQAANASAIVALFAPAMRRQNEVREGMSARDHRRDGGSARPTRRYPHAFEKAHARSRPATFGGARRAPIGSWDTRRRARRPGHDVPCMARRLRVFFRRVRRRKAPRRARNVAFGAPIRRAAANSRAGSFPRWTSTRCASPMRRATCSRAPSARAL